MSIRSLAAPLVLAALAVFSAACASAPPVPSPRVLPGDTFAFEGEEYLLQQVQEDFVLLRYVDPDDAPISGYVEEVFRVSRYDLGQGRWYAHRRLPGVYLQWLGLDAFALARGSGTVRGSEVVMLR